MVWVTHLGLLSPFLLGQAHESHNARGVRTLELKQQGKIAIPGNLSPISSLLTARCEKLDDIRTLKDIRK